MAKKINICLSDKEYRELVKLYFLGYMVKHQVRQQSEKAFAQDLLFQNKLSKQAFEQGSEHVFHLKNNYTITPEMEEEVLDLFDSFEFHLIRKLTEEESTFIVQLKELGVLGE